MEKCKFPQNVTIKPDGEHELDPCVYDVVAEYRNVTVQVLRCTKCGYVEFVWKKQDDTYRVDEEDEDE